MKTDFFDHKWLSATENLVKTFELKHVKDWCKNIERNVENRILNT